MVEAGARRRRACSRRCSSAPATSPSCEASPTTRRTRPGWRTSPELVAVAREFDDERSSRRGAARWPTSSSGSRWSPTPTRSPTDDAEEPTAASSR